MRRWEDSTFIFISTNQVHHPEGVEERWLPVMRALMERGASVRFLTLMGSPMGEWARSLGIAVDPYILDEWNVIRSHTRLRKYLKRYRPVVAHSTGVEGDLMLRWAARKIPEVGVAHTLVAEQQRTRRKRPIDALMLRLDELGMKHSEAVFVDAPDVAEEVAGAGVPRERIVMQPAGPGDSAELVTVHLELYRSLMAGRGAGR